MAGYADPIVTPNSGNTWLEGILWGSEWDSGGGPGGTTSIGIYIAGLNGQETITLDGGSVTAYGLYFEELQAIMNAMAAIEEVCGIRFNNVSSQANADVIWTMLNNADSGGFLGYANPPGTNYSTTYGDEQSLVTVNWESYNPAWPDENLLVEGGFDYITFIHELGHALGLAHPHDTGGGSTIFPGVSGSFGDYGDFDMNQGVFTMMSYNDGWQTAPHGLTPSTTYGYQMGPMALDIAALQFMYGANMTVRTGNDTYSLPESNGVGTGYQCIWDAGGIDRIVGAANLGNTIDLRAATLTVGPGGGGFVSFATGIHGGVTIANGVVIENATGGDLRDVINGNAAANTLHGLDGNDVMAGGNGSDRLVGGDGNDRLDGGQRDDVLRGGDGDDILTGGVGLDIMAGGEGADRFVFNALLESGATAATGDRIQGFVQGQDRIVLTGIDANELPGQTGNQGFVLDAGGGFVAGEIRQVLSGGNLILALNTDSDVAAEMVIVLMGQGTLLAASDFAL